MGWGAKRAAAPQPVSRDRPVFTKCAVCGGKQFQTPSGITCEAGHGGADSVEESTPEIEAETPEPNRLAEVEFMRLQANKGWTAERRYDVLRDFIRKSGLYLELNKFVRKMR